MQSFSPVDPMSHLPRKPDPKDPRLAELCTDGGKVNIIGYPDDEGIKLNGGRVGAALGPAEIRKWLYRMTPHARLKIKSFSDLGDLVPKAELSQRHEQARALTHKSLKSGGQVLSFGGGNDYAYPDGMAFLEQAHKQKPLIINIDAHLDVRNLSKGLTSGTPFFRLLESEHEFEFLEIGIQGQCNSREHWDYVESKGGRIVSLDEILDSGQSLYDHVVSVTGDLLLRPRSVFLAVDMDAFAWPYAVGTSAAWPIGLDPTQFYLFAQRLYRRVDVRVLGIYETSPPLDQGGGTARLAAQFAHGFLHYV